MYSFEHEEFSGKKVEHESAEKRENEHIIFQNGGVFMKLTLEEICKKEVINLLDGTCFGFADDIVIDTETKQVISIVMKGEGSFFGIFGREEAVFLPWERIKTIGKDTILVETDQKRAPIKQKANLFSKILNNLAELLGK